MSDRVVRVEWRDHTESGGPNSSWLKANQAIRQQLVRNVSVGRLIHTSKDALYVAGTWGDELVAHVQVIDRRCVTRCVTLVERTKTMAKRKSKVEQTMHEFKAGTLHSGSKKGPKVTSRKQAVAIALNQQRRSGGKSRKGKR